MSRSYLGLDAHCRTGLELAALRCKDGELLWRDRTPVKKRPLLKAVARAPKPCTVVFEEGELASWLHLTLKDHCERVLVADPERNRSIAQSPYKSDPYDAESLARLAMGGYVQEVYQPPEPFVQLRLLVRHEARLRVRVVQIKNQIKALYRQHGLVPTGSGVYVSGREQWLRQLPRLARELASQHYRELDVALESRQATKRRIQDAVPRFPPAVRLCTVPEIGPVTAATFVAYIVTPERFGSRKKIWTYCGYGLVQRSSGDSCEPVRLRKDRNSHLKRVLKMAVVRICQRPDHPLHTAYRSRRARGLPDRNAKLTTGRRLINIMTTLWTRNQEFDATKVAVA
jgi:transposase